MLRVAVLDDYQQIAGEMADWGSISGARVQFFHDSLQEPEALAERLQPFDVLVTMRERTRLPATLLERLPRLKLVSGTGRAQSHVDLEAATRLGIVVCGTGGSASGGSTTELAWALILASTRRITRENLQMRRGKWQTTVGVGLEGKTLGVLGLGRIGTRVAQIGQAMGMRVIAWGPTLTWERAAQHQVELVPWDALFSGSDVLTIHARLTDLSCGWVTARELRLMKPSAYLVNTARAAIVDQEALLEALHKKRIAGAGLDVYEEEPLPPDHPLLALDNVVLTPHLGYVTREALAEFYHGAIENVRAWQAGAPVNVQNPEVMRRR